MQVIYAQQIQGNQSGKADSTTIQELPDSSSRNAQMIGLVEVGKLPVVGTNKPNGGADNPSLTVPQPWKDTEAFKTAKRLHAEAVKAEKQGQQTMPATSATASPSSPPALYSSQGSSPSSSSSASTTFNSASLAESSSGPLTVATNYEGITKTSSPEAHIPPDVQVAAGPNHVVEMVNKVGAIWTKQGTLVTMFTLQDFYDTVVNDLADPRVYFDYQSGRWFATMFEIDHVNHDNSQPEANKTVYVAVSLTSDPTGSWYKYSIPYGTFCPDQPKIGLSADKVVLSVDKIDQCRKAPGTFIEYGPEYMIYKKSDLISGISTQSPPYSEDSRDLPIFPVQSDSDSPVLYMVRVVNDASKNGSVELYSISGSSAPFGKSKITLPIGKVDYPPDAIQPGTSYLIDTGDFRVQSAQWYKGKLWLAFNEVCPAIFVGDTTLRSCFKLVEIDTTMLQVTQRIDYGTGGYYYFYPALRMDGRGNLDVIFGFTSSSSYPSLAYVGRQPTDPVNTLQAPFTLVSGSAFARPIPLIDDCSGGFGGCRYGDYFGASIDPSDPGKVWMAGEFQSASGTSSIWKTQIASLVRSTISVGTDKSSYTIGETVTISGKATGIIPGRAATIQVYNPNGAAYRFDQVDVAADGSFTYSFVVGGSLGVPGTYSVTMSYNGASVQTTFVETSSSSSFPVTHMADTTQTYGSLTNFARPLNTELVSPNSQLVGDPIDRITLLIQRVGAPAGTAEIGIFGPDTTTKKLFGTINVANIPTTYAQYQFMLSNNELYTLQAGDRVGIKYIGGASGAGVNIMTDKDPTDPFDGQNTYRARYQSGAWTFDTAEDLWMILEQTHSAVTFTPITHMSDTTVGEPRPLYSGISMRVEYAPTSSSALVGKSIDQMVLRLAKVGSPSGTATVGVFDLAGNVKKQFGTIDVGSTALTTSFQDLTFSLTGSELYTISAGDRIGIKYTGGSSSSYVNVMTDTVSADPFDGSNSYRQWYDTAWRSDTSQDMYLVLRQTHP